MGLRPFPTGNRRKASHRVQAALQCGRPVWVPAASPQGRSQWAGGNSGAESGRVASGEP